MGIHSTGIFSERVTLESKPDGRKFRSYKSGSTRASDVVADIYATASFGLKMSIEKVRGNRKGSAISSHRHLSFGEEKKMRFSGGGGGPGHTKKEEEEEEQREEAEQEG